MSRKHPSCVNTFFILSPPALPVPSLSRGVYRRVEGAAAKNRAWKTIPPLQRTMGRGLNLVGFREKNHEVIFALTKLGLKL
jgi:hypothetical protein